MSLTIRATDLCWVYTEPVSGDRQVELTETFNQLHFTDYNNSVNKFLQLYFLWSPYVIGQTIIFLPCSFFLLLPSIFFFFA